VLRRHRRRRSTGSIAHSTCPIVPLAAARLDPDAHVVAEPVIEREEVVALLFNVSDIASALERIERLLEGDDGEEEADEG
jgi:hypothetical protein